MKQRMQDRRWLVKTLLLGGFLALEGVTARVTRADESGRLAVDDPAAVALGYVDNASKVDRQKYPSFAAGQNCENCLQLQGTAGQPYRPCGIFGGKLVPINGWCSSWTPEM